jgi:hypothetical protein
VLNVAFFMLSVIMLCCYPECRYAEYCYAECRYVECCYAECCRATFLTSFILIVLEPILKALEVDLSSLFPKLDCFVRVNIFSGALKWSSIQK